MLQGLIGVIAGGFVISAILKTLYKFMTVALFAGVLYYTVDIVTDLMKDYFKILESFPNIAYFMCRTGVASAINLYFSFLVAGWVSNKIINFLSRQ